MDKISSKTVYESSHIKLILIYNNLFVSIIYLFFYLQYKNKNIGKIFVNIKLHQRLLNLKKL